MEDNLNHIVYSKNVLEFVTVAGEYCHLIETVNEHGKPEFLFKIQKLLPLMYLKFTLLPKVGNAFDEIIEKFVTEEAWNYHEQNLKTKLGKHNDFLEVFDPNIGFSEGPLHSSISENLADIYQDIKDLITTYRIGNVDIMNDALWECQQNFENYWGQKLLNSLRAIHMVIYGNEGIEEETETKDQEGPGYNTDDWIITKMQEQHRRDYEDE